MHQLTHLLDAGFLRGAKGATLGFQRRNLFTQELVMDIHPKHTTTQATRDGGGCDADTADTTRKNGMSAATRRGWSVPSGTQRKESSQKLWTGDVLPLDRSLLMDELSILR